MQGSRPTPYIASVEVTPGDGMPVRRDITAHCSCPDDDNWDDRACKHVVAAMFAFSDELLIEPELLDVWRGREPGSSSSRVPRTNRRPTARPAPIPTCASCTRCRAAPAAVTRPANSRSSPTSPMSPSEQPDRLGHLLHVPAGAELPEVPVLDRIDLAPPRRHELGTVLSDALRHLRVDWD